MIATRIATRAGLLLAVAFASTLTVAAQPAATYPSGRAFYLAYRAAFTKARRLDDLLPWLAKSRRDEIATVPAADRAQGFTLMKTFDDHIDITVVKETPSASGAVLQVQAITAAEKAREVATVTLVKEGGAWRVGEESWKAVP